MTVLSPDETGRARIVEDGDFLDWVASLPTGGGLAVDTETAGFAWEDKVRLVQFGHRNDGYAVDADDTPLIQWALDTYNGPIIFHNASFDIRQLVKLGLDSDRLWPRAIDTFVMAHILNPDRFLNLDALSQSVLGENPQGYKKAFRAMMRKRKWTWATVPRLLLTPYGVQDAIFTFRLYEALKESVADVEWEVALKEMEVALAVWRVADKGIRLDEPYALRLQTEWNFALDSDRSYFKLEYGVENPNSNRQLTSALMGRGWQPSQRTPSGEVKLDKAILQSLAPDYDLVRRLLEYKRINKWLAAYVDNCLEQVDGNGRVHASYNILGAKTGRMSCSNPPLQQLPKGGGGEVRRLFIASLGNVIASVDYSSIEPRLAGALSGELRITDAFRAGEDLYQQIADDLGIERFMAKVVFLASLYGAGGKKIGAGLGISAKDAQIIVNEFWRKYPRLSTWVRRQSDNVAAGVPVYSKWGRRLRPHSPYAAANAIIQGTAAEVMKEGLLRLEVEGLLDYVVAIVHDEVVLDVPERDALRITRRVVETLRDESFGLPIEAEGAVYGRSWGDGYTGTPVHVPRYDPNDDDYYHSSDGGPGDYL